MVEYSRGTLRADDGAVRGYHPHLQRALPDGDGPCGQGRSGDCQDAPPEYCRWCLPPRTPHLRFLPRLAPLCTIAPR
eukprot:9489613-Pyramimonas_sp.AAC.1